jgi:AcrR family transcriptional regulator
MTQESQDLPASLAHAWGLSERPRRGPRPALSLEAIVEGAVRVAESEGIGAVSMARVAKEVGASTMGLYRYVAAKDELWALMVDFLGGPPPRPDDSETWREGLTRWAKGYMSVLRRHPWVVRIPISTPPITPNQVLWLEDGLQSFRATRLPEEEKLSSLLLVSGFVRNDATLMLDIGSAHPDAEVMPSYGRLLRRLTTADTHPAIHAALASGAFEMDDDIDTEFLFGLERVLDGIGLLIERRGLPAPDN